MITCGIATLHCREEAFKQCLHAIRPQVDQVIAVLNYYTEIPDWLKELPNVDCIMMNNEYTDAGKFLKVHECDGYYLALDDDLAVPPSYVETMLDGVERYNGIVSLHGKIYRKPVQAFNKWAYAFRCLYNVEGDAHVNVIGDGCCAFNTSRLNLSIDDFPLNKMSDLQLSSVATEQGVPMTVLKHKAGYLKYLLHPSDETIWKTTKDHSVHTKLLQSFIK